MIIYVNTENYREYANTPEVIWETIPVEVPDDFVGGATYDPKTKTWSKDKEMKLSDTEVIIGKIDGLRNDRSRYIQEAVFMKDIDNEEYEKLKLIVIDMNNKIKDLESGIDNGKI